MKRNSLLRPRTGLTRPLCLTFLAISSLPAAVPSEHVILVSINGWAHHYFDDPTCHMPAVKSLAVKGVRVKCMETSFPTVTWTNHTTLVSGAHPGRHAVLANDCYDRKERKKGAHDHDHLMPNMHGSCVISGAGIAKGKTIKEIQNVDITPTMARLLGFPFPDADGKVIEATLAK